MIFRELHFLWDEYFRYAKAVCWTRVGIEAGTLPLISIFNKKANFFLRVSSSTGCDDPSTNLPDCQRTYIIHYHSPGLCSFSISHVVLHSLILICASQKQQTTYGTLPIKNVLRQGNNKLNRNLYFSHHTNIGAYAIHLINAPYIQSGRG